MVRRKLLAVVLLLSFVLLVGCGNEADGDHYWLVSFSSFQKRFNKRPDDAAFACTPWQTEKQTEGNTVYSTDVWCNDQSRHVLEITANSNGNIFDITLKSEKEVRCISCFAEASYHVFCSMGFMDKDGKGNTPFPGPMPSTITFSFSQIRMLISPCGSMDMK